VGDLSSKFQVAGLCSGGLLGQRHGLEEGDDVFLPENALVLLLQIDKGVGRLGMPDVGLASLHPQQQVVADDLQASPFN
jgi:hypothetical protein